MKISNRTEVAATPAAVFDELSDFGRWEDVMRERGAGVSRLDGPGKEPGTAHWRVAFDFRGKRRVSEARVVGFEEDQQIAIKGESGGVTALVKLELVPAGSKATRLHASIELLPTTIKARLLVQSLKLARGKMEQRLAKRLEQFARRVERR